jgi:hypothetical protein
VTTWPDFDQVLDLERGVVGPPPIRTRGFHAEVGGVAWCVCVPRMRSAGRSGAAGEWVLMDSVTRLNPAGVGLADSAMSDSSGPVGRAAQSLLIARR